MPEKEGGGRGVLFLRHIMTSLLRQHKQSVRVWGVQEKESEKKGFTPLAQRKGVVHEHSQSVRYGKVSEREKGAEHTQCVVCVCQRRRGVEGTLLTHYQYECTS